MACHGGVATGAPLADATPCNDDLVAYLPTQVIRGGDSAGQINPRHHREAPQNGCAIGHGQGIFVVDTRIRHRDGDIAGGEGIAIGELYNGWGVLVGASRK